MNQSRVDNGLATEAAIFRKLGAAGVRLVENDRRQICEYALENLPDEKMRDRILNQASWLVDRLLSKESPVKAEMTGGNGRFADILCDDALSLSAKHNSFEIGGQRLSRRTINRLPFPGAPETTANFRQEAEPAFIALDKWEQGTHAEPWQRAFLHNTIGLAIVEELKRNPPLFTDVIPLEDHYMLTCSSKIPRIEGFNFNGTLNCSKVKPASGVPRIRYTMYRIRKTDLRCFSSIVIDYDGGWSLKLRLHLKDRITPSCFGGSTTIEGTPGGFFRLEP